MNPDTARLRARTRQLIHACQRCRLHETCTLPVPFTGPTPARLAIVGEAPGADEDKRNAPFVGASGQLIRSLLSENRFDPTTAFFCNAVSCRPPANRSPHIDELDSCRGNLDVQLRLADPDFILLLGATALLTVRPDLKVTQVHGHPFAAAMKGKAGLPNPYLRRPVYFPTFHPAAGLRDVGVKQQLKADIRLLVQLLNTPNHIEHWPMTCVKCGSTDAIFGPLDLLTYCPAHMPGRNTKIPDPPGLRARQEVFV